MSNVIYFKSVKQRNENLHKRASAEYAAKKLVSDIVGDGRYKIYSYNAEMIEVDMRYIEACKTKMVDAISNPQKKLWLKAYFHGVDNELELAAINDATLEDTIVEMANKKIELLSKIQSLKEHISKLERRLNERDRH